MPPVLKRSVSRPTLAWICAALLAGVLLALVPTRAQAASPGDLCLYGSDATADTGAAMQPGSSPSITPDGNGAEVAFQSSAGQLNTYVDSTGTDVNTGDAMESDTNPVISNGDIAFISPSDELWTGSGGSETATGQYAAPGTSPAVTNDNSGTLYAYINQQLDLATGNSTWTSYTLGAAADSSPSLAGLGDSWEATIEANVNTVYTLVNGANPDNTNAGVNGAGVAPIGGLSGSDSEFAYQATNDDLGVYGSVGTNGDTGEPMAAGTNPSLGSFNGNTYAVAYQGSNGDLWLYGAEGNLDTGHAMASGTSPAITQTGPGFEVAYQCAPAAAAPTPTAAPTVTTVTSTTTTPVTSTTPTTPPTHSHGSEPRIKAKYTLKLTWNGHSSYLYSVKLLNKLPRGSLITFSCRGTRADRCPTLGKLPKTKRTFAKELAVVAKRTFRRNNVLTISTAARHYRTELISIRLPASSAPRYSTRWK